MLAQPTIGAPLFLKEDRVFIPYKGLLNQSTSSFLSESTAEERIIMSIVVRLIQRAKDDWLIELDGEYFGPCRSREEALVHANNAALLLQMDRHEAYVDVDRPDESWRRPADSRAARSPVFDVLAAQSLRALVARGCEFLANGRPLHLT